MNYFRRAALVGLNQIQGFSVVPANSNCETDYLADATLFKTGITIDDQRNLPGT